MFIDCQGFGSRLVDQSLFASGGSRGAAANVTQNGSTKTSAPAAMEMKCSRLAPGETNEIPAPQRSNAADVIARERVIAGELSGFANQKYVQASRRVSVKP